MRPSNKYILLFFFIGINTAFAADRLHPEKYYQEKWCKEHGGITEYVLEDKARIDCLLDDYAIEFDFANKWAEAVGQSLYYALKTNKKPGIVLIIEREKDKRFLDRLQPLADKYSIKVWIISP